MRVAFASAGRLERFVERLKPRGKPQVICVSLCFHLLTYSLVRGVVLLVPNSGCLVGCLVAWLLGCLVAWLVGCPRKGGGSEYFSNLTRAKPWR